MPINFRKDLPEGDGGGKHFIKLKDKQSISGIFRGQPYEFFTIWEGGKPKEVDPAHPGAKFRFRINLVVKEGANYVVKIWEQSKTVYEQLGILNENIDLEKSLVKVIRSGSGMDDTVYTIIPTGQPISAEALRVIETLDLHNLAQPGKPKQSDDGDPQFGEIGYADEAEIPF